MGSILHPSHLNPAHDDSSSSSLLLSRSLCCWCRLLEAAARFAGALGLVGFFEVDRRFCLARGREPLLEGGALATNLKSLFRSQGERQTVASTELSQPSRKEM
jgi:hypothetical protein